MLERLKEAVSGKVRLLPLVFVAIIGVRGVTKEAVADTLERPHAGLKVDVLKTAFLKFCDGILANFGHVADPAMREKIRAVISTARNIQGGSAECLGEERFIPFGEGDELLCLRFRSKQEHPASTNGGTRSVHLTDGSDFQDMVSLVLLAHELTHAGQDDQMRKRVPWDRYLQFWSAQKLVVVPGMERDAIAVSLEMLNAAMDGSLKRAVLQGKPVKIPPTKDPYNKKFFERCAKEYFGSPATFDRFVERLYASVPGSLCFTPELESLGRCR